APALPSGRLRSAGAAARVGRAADRRRPGRVLPVARGRTARQRRGPRAVRRRDRLGDDPPDDVAVPHAHCGEGVPVSRSETVTPTTPPAHGQRPRGSSPFGAAAPSIAVAL